MSKKNPQLCTTEKSLTSGFSLYRISGLFDGKARVCWIEKNRNGTYKAIGACVHKDLNFKLEDVQSGKINIMCIERGE